MMNFSIKELNAFAVIGQEVELTNYQKKNIQISTQFWRKFNSSLKKSYLSQSGNWVKYAFMERRNGNLIISVLYQRELFFQTTFCIKKYRHINIWSWSILVLWGKYMKLIEKFIRKLFLIHHIPL